MLIAPLCFTGCDDKTSSSGSSSAVAQIAKEEYDGYANDSGQKYWSALGFGSRVEWCACFASYCAKEAGLTDEGYAPSSAAVTGWIDFYRDAGDKGSLENADTYTPVAGDFIIWNQSEDPDAMFGQHIAVVYSYDADTNKVTCIEGNYNDSMAMTSYDANSRITYYAHPASGGSAKNSSFGCSSSSVGSGETINIPDGLGTVHSFMGWQCITSPTSNQYKLREDSGEHYDSDGFGKIGDRYVIACTTTYGEIGDYVDFVLENGEVIHGVMGDAKNQNDAGCNKYGHQDGNCIVEFVVDKAKWYDNAHPGDPAIGYHEEWRGQAITKAVNCGNYWNGDSAKVSGSSSGSKDVDSWLTSCTSKNTNEATTEEGQRIIEACKTTPSPGANLCAAWVSNVYQNAGLNRPGGDACDMFWEYCKSDNQSDLKPGMIIAVPSNNQGSMGARYGHVGIYIGNNEVMSNVGQIRTESLDDFKSWNETNGYKCKWGWAM